MSDKTEPNDALVEELAAAILCAEEDVPPEYNAGFVAHWLAEEPTYRRQATAILPIIARLTAEARAKALDEVVTALEADAQQCDCFARSEGECACGAWSDYKTVPMSRAVEIVRNLKGTDNG